MHVMYCICVYLLCTIISVYLLCTIISVYLLCTIISCVSVMYYNICVSVMYYNICVSVMYYNICVSVMYCMYPVVSTIALACPLQHSPTGYSSNSPSMLPSTPQQVCPSHPCLRLPGHVCTYTCSPAPPPNRSTFNCPLCPQQHLSSSDLRTHVNSNHAHSQAAVVRREGRVELCWLRFGNGRHK